MIELTIESILELSPSRELRPLGLHRRKESIQGQTEEVIGQGTESCIGVDKAREASPSNFLLQLLQVQRGRMEQRRCRTPRDVIAQKRKSIADQRKAKGDDKGTRSDIRLVSHVHMQIDGATYGPKNS